MFQHVEVQVALITAFLAGLGYIVKSIFDWYQNRRKERARTIGQLQRLQSLLNAARATFEIQQEQVLRLRGLLEKNHPNEFKNGSGYEETMTGLFSEFNPEERESHSIIRAYTQYSLRKVNLEITDWLKADELFKTGVVKSTRRKELADNLFALEMHLLLWHAKYEAWIPNQIEHALVYMNDEKEHGLGFPRERVRKRLLSDGKTEESTLVDSVETDLAMVLDELTGYPSRLL